MKIENILNKEFNNHIFPLYWIKGEDFKTIEVTLDKMVESNIYSFILESRTHPDYMGDTWFRDVEFIVSEAKKRNMKFWLFDDNHFPTGSVNGALKDERPDLRKEVLKFVRFEVLGPQNNIKYNTHVYFDKTSKFHSIIAVSGEKTLDLTHLVKDDELYFDLPEGKWDIYLNYTSRETDFHKYHINMVDKESCDLLIENIYEVHYEKLKDHFGDTIIGFFTDEPGFNNEKGTKSDSKIGKEMPLPWSRYVEAKMKEAYGEKYETHIPSLWRERENSKEVRVTYMNIVTDLYLEFFDQRIGEWCRDRGLMHIGHIIEDRDSHARLGPGVGHFFKSMLGQDMAGVDIVLNQIQPGLDDGSHTYFRGEWDGAFFHYTLAKLGSSLGRIHPMKKGRTLAEVFGAFGWHEGTKLMKWIVDHFLVRGVNYYVPHAFSMDGFPDPDCPPHFYAHGNDPFFEYFKELMMYTQQVSNLISNGKYAPNVAVLYHAESEWAGEYMDITEPAKLLTRNLIDFDFIPQDVFKKENPYNTDLTKGLCVNENLYDLLVIPYSEYISKELYDYIQKGQSRVIFIDAYPKGLYNDDLEVDFKGVEVMALDALDEMLFGAKDLRGYTLPSKQAFLRTYRYEKEDEVYYLFFNEHPYDKVDLNLDDLSGDYLVDLMSDETQDWDNTLSLYPFESKILVTTNKKLETTTNNFQYEEVLNFDFEVSYVYPSEYPNFSEKTKITEPTNLTKELYSGKAGIFKYETEVKFPSHKVKLDLGHVSEAVTLLLNDEVVARRMVPPYHFTLDDLDVNETYKVSFEVSNTLNHQLQDILSFNEPVQPTGLLSNIKVKY